MTTRRAIIVGLVLGTGVGVIVFVVLAYVAFGLLIDGMEIEH